MNAGRARRIAVVFVSAVVMGAFAGLAAAGILDPGFGDAGVVRIDYGPDFPDGSTSGQVAATASGKVVIGGGAFSPFIVRLTKTGTPDPMFGSGGRVTFIQGAAAVRALAIDRLGRVVVGGFNQFGGYYVARLRADGEPDTTFANGGIYLSPFSFGSVEDLEIDASNRVLVATGHHVMRFTESGALDLTFGSGGEVEAAGGVEIELQANGKILATALAPDGQNRDLAVARFSADGVVDTSFGIDGIAHIDLGAQEVSSQLLLHGGRIIVGGESLSQSSEPSEVLLAAFRLNGDLDTTFGVDGLVRTPFHGNAKVTGLVGDKDRLMLVGNETRFIPPATSRMSSFAMLLTGDGRLDPTLAGGRVLVRLGADAFVSDVFALNRRFYAAGTSEFRLTVVRFAETASDNTGPALVTPGDHLLDATGPDGATVVYYAAPDDDIDPAAAVACTPSSGSVLPLGKNTVTCVGTDASGNTSTKAFVVDVVDRVPPYLGPSGLVQYVIATEPGGGRIPFQVPSAFDVVDGEITDVTCTPSWDSLFPLGDTLVTCSAIDRAGNVGTRTITIRVIPPS